MLEELLERVDKHEFEQLAETIKLSLTEHRKWMHTINLSLVRREYIDTAEFIAENAHNHCRFGKLMNRFLHDPIFHDGSFLKIRSLHVQVHETARELMLKLRDGSEVDIKRYEEFLAIQKDFFDLLLMIYEFSMINKHQFDETTNLMNRRTVDTVLSNEQHRMQRSKDSNCYIALADIDKFKVFNDNHGHAAGDRVLEHTAAIFHHSIRRHDTVARFGGEEFLFVLPDMTMEDAQLTIERVRTNLADTKIEIDGKLLGVTASFGITELCKRHDIKDSILNADTAMYKAKEHGRNRTYFADSNEIFDKITSTDNTNEMIRSCCYPVNKAC